MDVILISPCDMSKGDKNLFRENNRITDVDALKMNSINGLFLNRFRENLGIGALASYLKEHGYDVEIVDLNFSPLSLEAAAEDVAKKNPTLIGISLLYDLHSYNGASLIKQVRRAGYKGHISIGGAFSTGIYDHFLAAFPELNSVVRGEGEETILELVKCLKAEKDWTKIDGIAWRNGKEIVLNKAREVIDDLSSLPKAQRNLLEELKKRNLKSRAASMFTSRGCFGQCLYCSVPYISELSKEKKWRCKSPEAVAEEMKYLVDTYGVEFIYMCDDNFFGYGQARNQRLKRLAELIIEQDIKIKIHGEIRVDAQIDIEILKLLKKAGLFEVLLGLESGSQTALNRWRKGTTVEKNKHAVFVVKELGLQLEPAFIMADPYTTVEEFKENVKFIEETELYKCKTPLYLFNQMIVYHGTGLEKKILEDGLIKAADIWNIEEDLDNPEGLLDYCARISTYQYVIQDEKFRNLWDTLVKHINTLTYYSDVVIPDMIGKWRNIGGSEEKKVRLEQVRKLKKWKKQIGELVLKMLKETAEWSDTSDDLEKLDILLKGSVDDYNETYLAGALIE